MNYLGINNIDIKEKLNKIILEKNDVIQKLSDEIYYSIPKEVIDIIKPIKITNDLNIDFFIRSKLYSITITTYKNTTIRFYYKDNKHLLVSEYELKRSKLSKKERALIKEYIYVGEWYFDEDGNIVLCDSEGKALINN